MVYPLWDPGTGEATAPYHIKVDSSVWNTPTSYDTSYEKEYDKVDSKTGCPETPTGHEMPDLDRLSWKEFTMTTTFHGVKYIFATKQALNVRRLLWAVCVLSVIILFSIQVINRSQDYFQYLSNVNVEVVYTSEITFPSVTICNQNNYRITETVKRGLYDFIDQVFSVQNSTGDYVIPLNLDGENLTDFILGTAHQKLDFIDSCTWKGKSCNISNDFITTITDFGVCYTFNDGKTGMALNVSQSGAGFALSLILNIEEYEYMKGPQDEAGIKVLLHDTAEIPQLKDLGFAIAPGTHTLVAVQRKVVQALGHPYGYCTTTARARSHCISECRSREIIERCGCRDLSMPVVDNSNVCNMTGAFICVKSYHDTMTKEEIHCQCDVPCTRVTYEPQLSYAHLSKLSVDRISLQDPEKRQEVQKKFEAAREVAQRVDKVIADKDAEVMQSVLTWGEAYHLDLKHSYAVLEDPEYLLDTYNVTLIILESYKMLIDDFATIREIYTAKSYLIRHDYPSMYRVHDMIYDINLFTEYRDGISPLLLKLEECIALENEAANKVNNSDVKESPEVTTEYQACDDSGKYITYLYYRRSRAKTIVYYKERTIEEIEELESAYVDLISYLFRNSTYTDIDENLYTECRLILREVSKRWTPMIKEMLDLADWYLNTTSWTDKYNIAKEMVEFLNMTTANDSLSKAEKYEVCNWHMPPDGSGIGFDRAYGMFTAHKEAAEKSNMDVKSLIYPVSNQGRSLADLYEDKEPLLFQPTRDFLNVKITKLDIHQHMTSRLFKYEWENLKLTHDRYMADYKQFIAKASDVENNLWQSMMYAFNFSVPVLNDSVIDSLQLVAYARLRQADDDDVALHLGRLKTYRQESVLGLVDALYGKYRLVMHDVQEELMKSFQELNVAVTTAQQSLLDYAEDLQLNDQFFMNNFIKVDIFYKELGYERIKQQVSFEFLSLVSEIGGFMGLLLGASILTMCELMDYVAMSTIRRCRRQGPPLDFMRKASLSQEALTSK